MNHGKQRTAFVLFLWVLALVLPAPTFAIDLEKPKLKAAPTEAQALKPEEFRVEEPLIEKDDLKLMRAKPRFTCSFDLGVSWPKFGDVLDLTVGAWIYFGITNNASADEVELAIDLSYWDQFSKSFIRYPNSSPELYQFSDLPGGEEQRLAYSKEIDGGIAGCYQDSQNEQQVNCRYQLTVDISYRLETGSTGGSAPVSPPGAPPSSSDGWEEGAHCEDEEAWSITQE